MTLYPVAGTAAGYPVSTDSFGARQDTSDLTQEILAQVPDADPSSFVLPWSSGALTVNIGEVTITYLSADDAIISSLNAGDVRAGALRGPLLSLGGSPGASVEAQDGGYVSFTTSGSKAFVIDHPADPDRWLVHVCLEGPEAAVFYRGEIRLDGVGSGHVELPAYFTALVDESTATVQVTPLLDGPEDSFGPIAATRVEDGRFVVRGWPMQNVAWRVEATRRDVPPVDVEPLKSDVKVHGTGPYRWVD